MDKPVDTSFSPTRSVNIYLLHKVLKQPELLLAEELFLFKRKQNNSNAECSLSAVPIQNSLPVFS